MTSTEQRMLAIQALDPEATVKVNSTGYHYVKSSIEVTGPMVGAEQADSLVPVQRSDHMAISTFLQFLTELPPDQFLVTEYKGKRREWRWNGAAFAECTRDEVL